MGTGEVLSCIEIWLFSFRSIWLIPPVMKLPKCRYVFNPKYYILDPRLLNQVRRDWTRLVKRRFWEQVWKIFQMVHIPWKCYNFQSQTSAVHQPKQSQVVLEIVWYWILDRGFQSNIFVWLSWWALVGTNSKLFLVEPFCQNQCSIMFGQDWQEQSGTCSHYNPIWIYHTYLHNLSVHLWREVKVGWKLQPTSWL